MLARLRPLADLLAWLVVVAIFGAYTVARRDQIGIALQRAAEANSPLASKIAYAAVGGISALLLITFSLWLTIALIRRVACVVRVGCKG